MPHSNKLVQDLASKEYLRLSAELKVLVFDDSWSEDEKRTIQKYLRRKQSDMQVLLNSKSNLSLT